MGTKSVRELLRWYGDKGEGGHDASVQAYAALEIGDALREVACAINNLVPVPLTEYQYAQKMARDQEICAKVAGCIASIFGDVSDPCCE